MLKSSAFETTVKQNVCEQVGNCGNKNIRKQKKGLFGDFFPLLYLELERKIQRKPVWQVGYCRFNFRVSELTSRTLLDRDSSPSHNFKFAHLKHDVWLCSVWISIIGPSITKRKFHFFWHKKVHKPWLVNDHKFHRTVITRVILFGKKKVSCRDIFLDTLNETTHRNNHSQLSTTMSQCYEF